MKKVKRRFLTVEQALSIIPDREEVHTNIQKGMMFIGADWSRNEIICKINQSEIRELAGPFARGMGHGLVLYDKNAKYQSDLLFVETDMARLNELDPQEESENEQSEV